jgi:hypothetical protein
MTPEQTQNIYGAVAVLRGFMPFVEKLAPAEAPLVDDALQLIAEGVRLLERHGNIDDAREALAASITTAWQARLDERFRRG